MGALPPPSQSSQTSNSKFLSQSTSQLVRRNGDSKHTHTVFTLDTRKEGTGHDVQFRTGVLEPGEADPARDTQPTRSPLLPSEIIPVFTQHLK